MAGGQWPTGAPIQPVSIDLVCGTQGMDAGRESREWRWNDLTGIAPGRRPARSRLPAHPPVSRFEAGKLADRGVRAGAADRDADCALLQPPPDTRRHPAVRRQPFRTRTAHV